MRPTQIKFSNPNAKQKIGISSKDLEDNYLTSQILGIIYTNSSDPNFQIEDLCTKLGLSRTQIHRKLKATLNTNFSSLLLAMRLNGAIELLHHSNLTNDEISDLSGFRYSSYFIRVFQKKLEKHRRNIV